jgi:hypothetical protein
MYDIAVWLLGTRASGAFQRIVTVTGVTHPDGGVGAAGIGTGQNTGVPTTTVGGYVPAPGSPVEDWRRVTQLIRYCELPPG